MSLPLGGVHGSIFSVNGAINGCRNWQISDAATAAVYANSATGGGHGRKTGIQSWAGSYGAHGGVPSLFPGNIFSFAGYTAPDNDTKGANGALYSGSAIVDSLSLVWDFASGNVLSHQVQFSGHLGLTPSLGVQSDATISDPEPMSGCSIVAGAVTVGNITQATLTITAANQPYVNSSTGGLTGRKPGLIDWNVQLNVEDTLLYAGLTKGNDYILKMYVTASTYWSLKWSKLIESTNLTTNAETAAIISQTLNFGMNAQVGGVLGSLIAPAAGSSAWGT